MKGIDVKQNWPDAPENASEDLKKLINYERDGIHNRCERVTQQPGFQH